MAPSELRAWVAAGDTRRAGQWLVEHHTDEVMALCVSMVSDRAAAEDLVQDVFSRAFAGLDQFRGDASVRSWLLTIARNRCIDHLRARQRDPWHGHEEELEGHAAETPLPPDLLSRRAQVEAALSSLGEVERALVVLRFKNGLEYRELADAFGLREGTVRMRVSRALAKMRDALSLAAKPPVLLGAPSPTRTRTAPVGTAAAPSPGAPPPSPPAAARAGRHALSDFFAAIRDEVPTALRSRLAELVDRL